MQSLKYFLLSVLMLPAAAMAAPVPLFDGKTLDQWEGDARLWRVEEGLITGGSLTEPVQHNVFLATKKSYHNFDLRLKIRIRGTEGFINSGVQIRSVRVPDNTEMAGYQCDAGEGWWGKIYDESRRNKVIAVPAEEEAVVKSIKKDDWNDYRVLAEGPRIRTWINGIAAADYTEADPKIALDGHIGVQVHGGGKALVQVKEVSIDELPATPDAPTWDKVGRPGEKKTVKAGPAGYNSVDGGPRTPDEQLKSFKLPEGFTAELVLAESEGIGKFVTCSWDAAGRLWTMSALDYPVDGNENAAAADALYERGGKDKILVIDNPSAPGPHTPRVFAEKLALPLGILPWKDGAIIQYGHDIRHYRDTDGDGKSDKYDVLLTGFGVQDSHLFPHQFTRGPGGWMYLAQGLFNYSTARRADGKPFASGAAQQSFNMCKLARMRFDGSDFQLCTAGPNNIWGFVIDRSGSMFLQEANDIAFPVAEYEFGMLYPTGSSERLQPYQPMTPESTKGAIMGGTGLSGLAIAEDSDWPEPHGPGAKTDRSTVRHFYIANPITNRVQLVKAQRAAAGGWTYEKAPDFLVSDDQWFRPVAVHFGPDGCLYVVDWYNKIISHNEIPRNDPARDKIRGRIWRIRHDSQPKAVVPDLTKPEPAALIASLGNSNALVSKLAWQEVIDRNDISVWEKLRELAVDGAQPEDRRLAALWAFDGLLRAQENNKFIKAPEWQTGARELAKVLAADRMPDVRAEAVRFAGGLDGGNRMDDEALLSMLEPLTGKAGFRELCAIGDVLIHRREPSAGLLALAIKLGREPLAGNDRAAFERTYIRYLTRWALQNQPAAVAALLNSPAAQNLPAESRLFAVLAIDPKDGAPLLAGLLSEVKRELSAEELVLLAGQINQPAVKEAITSILRDPVRQAAALAAIEKIGEPAASAAPMIAEAARALTARDGSAANRAQLVRLARIFRLAELENDVAGWLSPTLPPGDQVLCLKALAELRSERIDVIKPFASAQDAAVRREAVTALSGSRSAGAAASVAELWVSLPSPLRKIAVDRLTSSRAGAEGFLTSVKQGTIPSEDVDGAALDRVSAALGQEHPLVAELARSIKGALQPVLRLRPDQESWVETGIHVSGPFTIECWVRLDEGINNADHLLGQKGGIDMNFFDGKFRLYAGGAVHDVIVARTPMKPDTWTHVALTRDTGDRLRIYMNGELDQDEGKPWGEPMSKLNLGQGNQPGGAGSYTELRVWNRCLAPEEIRDTHRQSFATEMTGTGARPAGLTYWFGGSTWPKLQGGAAVEQTRDFPELLNAAQNRELTARFARYRELAAKGGDPVKGKNMFITACATCHKVQGQGGQIGPDLSGAGAMGTEALLRNLLTPNAQLESGYYLHIAEIKNGDTAAGILVSQDADSVVIRAVGAEDRRIPRTELKKLTATRRSMMPEGLLDGFPPEMVSDLFAWLATLR